MILARTLAKWTLSWAALLWILAAIPYAYRTGAIGSPAFWAFPGTVAAIIPTVVFVVGYRLSERDGLQLWAPLVLTAGAAYLIDAWVYPLVWYEGLEISGNTAGMAPFGPLTPVGLMDHWAWMRANGSPPYGLGDPYRWPPNYLMWMWSGPLRTVALTLVGGYAGWAWTRILAPGSEHDAGATVVMFQGRVRAHVTLVLVGVAHGFGVFGAHYVGRWLVLSTDTPGLAATGLLFVVLGVLSATYHRLGRAMRLRRGRQARAMLRNAELLAERSHGRIRKGDSLSFRSDRDLLAVRLSEDEVADYLGAFGPDVVSRRATPVRHRPRLEIHQGRA